ncbi:MAG: VOC family protein [candidate division Zixibacteria bacterium]|nr:VOC family protein [candidate division Zixibacteria bacterium]
MADGKRNAINWFEIPANNFQRAVKFYETILGSSLHTSNMGGCDMAFLPADEGKVGGAVIQHGEVKPSGQGTRVYLNCNPDLAPILARVEAAGGKVEVPKTQITPEIGFFAFVIDSEGNRVGLHSMS